MIYKTLLYCKVIPQYIYRLKHGQRLLRLKCQEKTRDVYKKLKYYRKRLAAGALPERTCVAEQRCLRVNYADTVVTITARYQYVGGIASPTSQSG